MTTDRCPTCESGTRLFTRIGYPGKCPDRWHRPPSCPTCGAVRGRTESRIDRLSCADDWHDRPSDNIAIDLPEVLQAHAGWLRDTDVAPPRERLVHDLLRAAARIKELEEQLRRTR